MASLEIQEYLRQTRLFAGLSDARLQRVAEIARLETLPRGTCLAQAGQPGHAYYYLLSGEAVVRAVLGRGKLRPVAYLHAGDSFGVTSLLLGEPHDATVTATTDLVVLMVLREDLARLLAQDPEMEAELALPPEISTKLHHEHFTWLEPGEVVILYAHRHPWVFIRSLPIPGLIAAALAFLLLLLLRFAGIYSPWLVALLPLLLWLPAVLWQLVEWRNDYYIVTTQRVVRRDLVLLQYETRHEAPLNRIQDVSVKRDVWGNLLGYGTLLIDTAAQSGIGRIVFDFLSDPEEAKSLIFQQLYRAQALSSANTSEAMRRELRRRLGWTTPEEPAQGGATPPQEVAPPSQHRSIHLPRVLPAVRLERDGSVIWRKHPMFLFKRLLKPLAALAAFVLLLILYSQELLPFLPFTPLGAILCAMVGLLPITFWCWWEYQDWANDIYVVTDERIIDIEKKPLFFAEERREASLDRIQNVNLRVPGPIAAALNYGDVDIETASGEGKFTFTHVVAPHDVQREIMSRVARQRERRQQFESAQRRREIADWFAAYEGLREQRTSDA